MFSAAVLVLMIFHAVIFPQILLVLARLFPENIYFQFGLPFDLLFLVLMIILVI